MYANSEGKVRIDRRATLWDRFWKNKRGDVVIYQRPNIFLIIWIVFTVASLFVPHGVPENTCWIISMVSLTIWAVLEIWSGVNYFRRVLGAIVLLFIILAVLRLA